LPTRRAARDTPPAPRALARIVLSLAGGRCAGGVAPTGESAPVHRTIAAAALVFAFIAFALHRAPVAGRFEEPVLLLVMGTLFLVVGKLVAGEAAAQRRAEA
jgi:hypothetical protein